MTTTGGRSQTSAARSRTYSMICRPAARCSTFTVADFMRVPIPAARMITSRSFIYSLLRIRSVSSPHPLEGSSVPIVEAEDRFSERACIVSHVVPFCNDVAEEGRHAELANGGEVERHRILVLFRVRLQDRLGRPASVDHHDV